MTQSWRKSGLNLKFVQRGNTHSKQFIHRLCCSALAKTIL